MERSIVLEPCRRIDGSMKVPGDKSISHRALMVAMINEGRAELSGLVPAADVLSTLDAVDRLGTLNLRSQLDIEIHEGTPRGRDFQISVDSLGWDALASPGDELDVGNSGTTIRLLTGILAGSAVSATLRGDTSLSRRPMARVVEPLRAMGADVTAAGPGASPPIVVRGAPLVGVAHDLPIASAQVKSALIFAGMRASGETSIHEPARSRDHTERLLRAIGCSIDETMDRLVVKSTYLQGDWSLNVPGDLSSAAFFLVAAAILPGSQITILDLGVNPTRAGILEILSRYGASVVLEDEHDEGGEPVATVTVAHGLRRPLEVSGQLTVHAIDELPLVAILAAFADGVTTVRDAEELRVKESDRISAICDVMSALGVEIRPTDDGFEVDGREGRGLAGAHVDALGDHRIAMAAAVAGIALSEGETIIDGWDSVGVSYPWFAEDLASVTVR